MQTLTKDPATQQAPRYSLGASDHEISRLDTQAAAIEEATRLLLRVAGIAPGMRVLDLGTGIGHVAMLVADLVGPNGAVVGIDTSAKLLGIARQRAAAQPRLTFVEGDVRSWRDGEPFDAVVARLILFHLPDAAAVLAHHLAALRPGGLLLALDFDLGAVRTEPAVPLCTDAAGWMNAAFRDADACPVIGVQLAALLAQAGLAGVRTLGIQEYSAADDPRGPQRAAAVVQTLAPRIVAAGIATAQQLGIDTLTQRMSAAVQAEHAVMVMPTLVGAWGRR
jgi:SAM-dependent methyltransferase